MDKKENHEAFDEIKEKLNTIGEKAKIDIFRNTMVKPKERIATEEEKEGQVYLVYSGEFETDKPRNHMAEPSIIMITSSFSKARNKFLEVLEEYRKMKYIDLYYNEEDIARDNAPYNYYNFEFNYSYGFGKVGILKEILED